MNVLDKTLPSWVVSLAERVQEKLGDFDVYIAGGFLRDTFNGNTYKDVDLVLVPKQGLRQIVPPLTALQGFFVQYVYDAKDISDMEDRGVYHLIGLRSGVDVQFITYAEHHTQEYITTDMDFGINQITYHVNTGVILASDNYIKGHKDKEIENFHSYCPERMYERFVRMSKRFPEYAIINMPERPVKELKVMVSGGRSGCSVDLGLE